MEESRNLFLVAIVAVVAFVGVVVLYLLSTTGETYYLTDDNEAELATGEAGRLAAERVRIPAPDTRTPRGGRILLRTLPCPDADKDGFPLEYNQYMAEVKPWMNACKGVGSDCNDNNPLVNPKAQEVCNQVDDNCDGYVDQAVVIRGRTTSVEDICPKQEKKCDKICFAGNSSSGRGLDIVLCCIDNVDCGNTPKTGGFTTFTINFTTYKTFHSSWAVSDTCKNKQILNESVCPTSSAIALGDFSGSAVEVDCQALGLECIDPDGSYSASSSRGAQPAYCGKPPQPNVGPCADGDGDGFQNPNNPIGCMPTTPLDCDDTKATVNPNIKEACNDADDNCDGIIDETPTWKDGIIGGTIIGLDYACS